MTKFQSALKTLTSRIGAYTGENICKDDQIGRRSYVILGHSERRQYFGESNELLAKKTDTH